MTVPPPILPPPTRFRVRYGVCYCTVCGFAAPFCKGHAPTDPPSPDGAESNLARRIAQARGGR